jgi:hypothetical protein
MAKTQTPDGAAKNAAVETDKKPAAQLEATPAVMVPFTRPELDDLANIFDLVVRAHGLRAVPTVLKFMDRVQKAAESVDNKAG